MNNKDLSNILEEKFKDCLSTLKDTSFDNDNNQYLCFDEEQKVYNFDDYVKKIKQIPASPDAIFLNKGKLYFIEFKNSYYKDINKRNIKNKFRKGAEIIQEIIEKIYFSKYQFIFCVIYKKNPQTQRVAPEKIKENLKKRVEGLKDINKDELSNFYDTILVNDIDFFKKKFRKIKKENFL